MKRTSSAFSLCRFHSYNVFCPEAGQSGRTETEVGNPLFHHLDKAPRTPAFECEGYWAWGSSVVKGDDGKYHMFVSRFPKSLPFHPG